MGFVYVMEAGDYCKIGISESSVEQRKLSIQTGCPYKIGRVWCSRNIPDHLQCERILHNYFREKNTSGEWFEVRFFDAAEKAEKVCEVGADKETIRQLQEENRKLREQLSNSYTQEELVSAILQMLNKSRQNNI